MHTPSFLTRNAGALAHHHPSSVLSPDDDDLDDVMMMIQWAAETHFLKLPKYVCRVCQQKWFPWIPLWMHCNSWILVPLVGNTLIVLAI
jgi:hypothetical protein